MTGGRPHVDGRHGPAAAPPSPEGLDALAPATGPATAGRPAGRAGLPPADAAAFDGPRFAEAIARAWWSGGGGARTDIPLGIVATLALWPIKTDGAGHAPALAAFITRQPAARWPATVGQVAAWHWVRRPDLMETALPLLSWAEEEHPAATVGAAKAVADAALRNGILEATGHRDPYLRSHVDVMFWALNGLRHSAERAPRGEYQTPAHIGDLIARMLTDSAPAADRTVGELAAGTGGLARAAAQAMRKQGEDPHQHTWHLQELDPLAAAAAAVNALVWDLGPGATVTCSDTLRTGDRHTTALDSRQSAARHRDRVLASARTIAAQESALRHLGHNASEHDHP
ncbi:N-6 DNA methylase [Kitasatospora purpeofusca]|uniref:N-6 DNA methylase n=1 Tax=Kitasatospora purpeofusca TaxID=67352 RepID=UPI0035DFEBAB